MLAPVDMEEESSARGGRRCSSARYGTGQELRLPPPKRSHISGAGTRTGLESPAEESACESEDLSCIGVLKQDPFNDPAKPLYTSVKIDVVGFMVR